MKPVKRDDTLFLIVDRKPDVAVPEPTTLEEARLQLQQALKLAASMRHLVKDALQTAHSFVLEASDGMEFDLDQVRSRMKRDGVRANVRAFRTGSLYKRSTQFDLLQRLDAAFERLGGGQEALAGTLMAEDEDY